MAKERDAVISERSATLQEAEVLDGTGGGEGGLASGTTGPDLWWSSLT